MFNCADVTVNFVVTLLSDNLSPKDRTLVSEPAGETMKASFLSKHNASISARWGSRCKGERTSECQMSEMQKI